MKATLLAFAAALLVSPVFAGDLCDSNLQKIDDTLKSTNNATLTEKVSSLRDKAAQEKASGDTKACISTTSEALVMLERTGGGGTN
ncbi:hypothetical protein D3C76_621390 [compost metagenome]